MQITHYDLFAGIGGFSYALDTIFNEHEIKHIFCEWEQFPTAVLKKHWPDATYYGDIADLVADSERKGREGELRETEGQHRLCDRSGEDKDITILTGGFPCQPFSHAGRRKGTADDRYKWPEMFAVIRNVKPDWVIAENVRGFATWNDGLVLERTCADLESESYEVQPFIIPACAVQAPHQRERVWIVAHAVNSRQGGTEREDSNGVFDGHAPNTNTSRLEREGAEQQTNRDRQRSKTHTWEADWREVAFATCNDGVDDGLPRRMDGTTISASRHRKERLKACGNAIVPQVAMEIFKAIKQSI